MSGKRATELPLKDAKVNGNTLLKKQTEVHKSKKGDAGILIIPLEFSGHTIIFQIV